MCGLLRRAAHLQEYLFRGIQKSEWQNLFAFIQAKRLRIENLREAELGPAGGGGVTALDLGDDIDTGTHQASTLFLTEVLGPVSSHAFRFSLHSANYLVGTCLCRLLHACCEDRWIVGCCRSGADGGPWRSG